MQFYVYKLIDPRTDATFYVGKGKGKRAWVHTKLVAAGKSSGNKAKDAIISEILRLRKEPIVEIVARYKEEADAFKHEIELIATLPNLCNLTKGGEGWGLSKAEIKRRERRAAIIRRIKLSNWFAVAKTWPACTVKGHPNGDAIGREVFENIREILKAEERLPTTLLSKTFAAQN